MYTKDGTKIRLHGIGTPEHDQPYGKQATRALDSLIRDKIFVLKKDTERYGRLVAVLYTPEEGFLLLPVHRRSRFLLSL